MPTLYVANGYFSEISGLGKNKEFSELSVKRVTKAVREHLGNVFGEERPVTVSCSAEFNNAADCWEGNCRVYDAPRSYSIVRGK
jgi:hypothetical protein